MESILVKEVKKTMPKEKEGLLIYDLEQKNLNFGEQGRKEISDSFVRQISEETGNE